MSENQHAGQVSTKDVLTFIGMAITIALSYGVSKSESATQIEKINQLEHKVDNAKRSEEALRLALAETKVKLAGESARTSSALTGLVKQLDDQKDDFLAKDRVLEALADVKELKQGTVPERRILHIEDDITETETKINNNESDIAVITANLDGLIMLAESVHESLNKGLQEIKKEITSHESQEGHTSLARLVSKHEGNIKFQGGRITQMEEQIRKIQSQIQKKTNKDTN